MINRVAVRHMYRCRIFLFLRFPKGVEQKLMCVTVEHIQQGIDEMCALEGKWEAGHGRFESGIRVK
jgi:hypothetical protein